LNTFKPVAQKEEAIVSETIQREFESHQAYEGLRNLEDECLMPDGVNANITDFESDALGSNLSPVTDGGSSLYGKV
jgi:hypothetical protein